ncbi:MULTISPECIES: LacI family DNA-binding transcriptional regulator [unclassified Microbacterium]|uniref:LacI family DNA-binding transcriptional regulator n=1 Tax=unclassified Microbacterium TaxID=2609290 RepID=UPI001D9D88D4|nr:MULTISPECIES: LacI family DNA-binding transcriptional regulator [unclassified Microbacterium]CAH0126521.1 HTH-type transcriptional regulator DegA [Microbacterium sp. Bi121]HWK77036.1 LacI family DNA-binding transcriptional regulator [Microbacterium sp.]
MNRRTTINDVALAAGVSVATVSKAINGRYGVSPETLSHVMGIVEDLGYESSIVATSMRRRSTNVIGVLVAEFEPFALQLLRGVSTALETTDYDVLAYAGSVSAGEHLGWERRSLSRLGGTLIDGAILVTPTTTPTQTSVPIVAVDPHVGAADAATVTVANVEGAQAATEHLISLGHRRIAHLRGRTDLESAREREQGYRSALEAAGIPFDPTLVVDGSYRAADSTAGANAILDLADTPTAVFAANDLSAIEMMRVAAERGLRVPSDLSVVGFDDILDAGSHVPQLTTVRQPLPEMGTAAVRMLLDVLQGHDPEPIRMPTTLVVRESTAPPHA